MKTILATTDFSANANRATHFAAQLALAQKAHLILLHTFHFWPGNPAETGLDFPLSAQAMQAESQHTLNELAHELHTEYGEELPIRCLVKEGNVLPTIQEVAQAEKADLLLMCTVGSSPQSAQLMGSLATKMIAETNRSANAVPLLLIPPSVTYTNVMNAVLAIDLDTPPDAVVLDTAFRLARQFGCVVNLICVHDNPTDVAVRTKAEHIRHLMGTIPHTLTIQPGGAVYETLLTFAQQNKADLMMMLPQEHNWFRRLFVEGETERMARLTDIPLLAVS